MALDDATKVDVPKVRIADREVGVRSLLSVGDLFRISALWAEVLVEQGPNAPWLAIAFGGGQQAIQALAIATDTEAKWISELTLPQFAELALRAWRTHEHELTRFIPELAAVVGWHMQRYSAMTQPRGAAPSQHESPDRVA
jgi:hypothetical protein